MKDDGAPSERSIITVLAADMVGSTRHIAACDPDDAQLFLDRWFEHVRDAVERAGGLIVSYEGDGGIAVFGWPSALEDHADRACAAAWDIHHRGDAPGPNGEPVAFRVGVHSGLVGLRQTRQGGKSRFDTVGATVNIAAKLEQCAPSGGVIVSAQAVGLCRTPLKLTRHGSTPILAAVQTEAFRLDARPENTRYSDVARRYPAPMVGRLDELARLREVLPRAGGPGGSVALIGEAGIGKSRLAAAAITEVLGPGLKVLTFYGDAQKRTTPFAAARALIGDLLRPHGGVFGEASRAALADAGMDAADIGALETLLNAPTAGRRGRTANLTDTQIARVMVSAFCALAHDRPTVLLIEDLHVIDAESRRFLRLLARARTAWPLCLLLTGRPEALRSAGEIAQSVIRLDPLPRDDMETLGWRLWPGPRPPAFVLERAVERADGVPFVLEELIRSVDAKDVAAFQPLPHSVESGIHARLQHLTPSAKALAQALSLLGEEVEIEFARAVLGAETGSLLNDLAELERFAFVHPVAGHSTRLRHQIIAEACADTIPRGRRRQLHRAAVQAITARFSDLVGRHEQLAFHAEGAGDDPAALSYLWGAGLEARRNSAVTSLNLIFDRALHVIERIGEAAEGQYVDFVLMACASMLQLGEFEKMNLHLPRATDLARRQDRPGQVCSAMSQLGMICWFEGRYAEGLRITEEGLAMAHALDSPALIFSTQLMLANVLHDMGRVSDAIAVQRQLCDMLTGELESARLGSPAIPRSTALSFMGWFLPDIGQCVEGIEFAERGLEIAVREQEPYSEVLARHALARNFLLLHRDADAFDCLAIALDLSESNGLDTVKVHLTGRMAAALSRTGRAGEAVGLVEACLRDGLHLRTGRMEVFYLQVGYAEALIGSGEVDRGLAALAHALAIARKVGNPCLTIDALGLRARLVARVTPGDPAIEADLREQRDICERFGLVAWGV